MGLLREAELLLLDDVYASDFVSTTWASTSVCLPVAGALVSGFVSATGALVSGFLSATGALASDFLSATGT